MSESDTIEQSAEVNSEKTNSATKKYIAELLGTFVLVLVGCGTMVFSGLNIAGVVGISLAFGLPYLALFYTIGGISGCHINPAVSISMLALGKIKAKDAAFYIVAQCIGAIVAATTLYAIGIGSPQYSLATAGLGENGYGNASPAGFSMISAFIAELLLTFMFVLVFHGSTSEKAPKGFAGVSIGLSLVFIHLFGIPITYTSVNPARSLGPAVIVGILADSTALSQLWLFWVAPIIGGLLAAIVWRLLER
jgi:aquaporin Z